jgi:hypothetical protein
MHRGCTRARFRRGRRATRPHQISGHRFEQRRDGVHHSCDQRTPSGEHGPAPHRLVPIPVAAGLPRLRGPPPPLLEARPVLPAIRAVRRPCPAARSTYRSGSPLTPNPGGEIALRRGAEAESVHDRPRPPRVTSSRRVDQFSFRWRVPDGLRGWGLHGRQRKTCGWCRRRGRTHTDQLLRAVAAEHRVDQPPRLPHRGSPVQFTTLVSPAGVLELEHDVPADRLGDLAADGPVALVGEPTYRPGELRLHPCTDANLVHTISVVPLSGQDVRIAARTASSKNVRDRLPSRTVDNRSWRTYSYRRTRLRGRE